MTRHCERSEAISVAAGPIPAPHPPTLRVSKRIEGAAKATFGASLEKSRRMSLPIVWKCTGNPEAATASHIGFHDGCDSGILSPPREISGPRTPPRGDPLDLADRGVAALTIALEVQ